MTQAQRRTPAVAPGHVRERHRREWRQLRLLTRDGWRRLLDSVVFARDADPVQFALWGLTLATTLPLVMAIRKVPSYGFMEHAPAAVVMDRVLADRLFFLTYGMLASALLAALAWDALFPDRADQEIVGVLPVRPRTLAAARLAAATGMAFAFAAAINLPAGLVYSLAAASHPLLASLPRLLAAHLIATTLASAFVFLGLMLARGLIAICAGERMAARLAIVLQLIAVVAFVEVFMFLPGVLPFLVTALQDGSSGYALLPPVWFGALYGWLAEGDGLLAPRALLAVWATLLTAAALTTVTLAAAAWMGRRALETTARERASGLMVVARAVVTLFVRSAPVREMFLFAVASLARSRRHALVLATYVGLAIATGAIKLIVARVDGDLVLDRATSHLLTLPMLFLFFAVFGLKVAFGIPTDVDANWPLRLSQPTVRQVMSVTRRLLLTLAVAPVALAWLVVTLALWPAAEALRAWLLMLGSGIALTEAALGGWTKVPFAAAHEPSATTLRKRWPLYLIAFYAFGFLLAYIQARALLSAAGTAWYLGVAAATIVAFRLKRERDFRGQTPTFDATDPESPATLNLSEAAS